MSLIGEDLVPGNAYTGEVACFKGVSQISQRRPVAKVLVRVGQKKFWMEAVVVEELAGDMLLGRNCKEHLHLIRGSGSGSEDSKPAGTSSVHTQPGEAGIGGAEEGSAVQ